MSIAKPASTAEAGGRLDDYQTMVKSASASQYAASAFELTA